MLLIEPEETIMSAHSATCDWTSEKKDSTPSRFWNLVTSIRHELRIRRALRHVSTLDDAMLHDIGIGPGGIEDAVRCGRR
jgi:uncharacterized protein YjiS (DUF1127 family)